MKKVLAFVVFAIFVCQAQARQASAKVSYFLGF
jgi:hypothetical protein